MKTKFLKFAAYVAVILSLLYINTVIIVNLLPVPEIVKYYLERNQFKQAYILQKLYFGKEQLCYSPYVINWLIHDKNKIFLSAQEKKNFYQKTIDKNYQVSPSRMNRIPKITHRIWLTNINSPKKISNKDSTRTNTTLNSFAKADNNFTHYFWTNHIETVENEVKKFNNKNIIIKHIRDLHSYDKHKETINYLINFNYAAAKDFFSYLLLEYYGGITLDLDTEINDYREIGKILSFVDFFAANHHPNGDITFGFLASIPNHPIVKEAIRISKYNADFNTMPKEIRYACSSNSKVGAAYGVNMFTIPTLNYLGFNGNIDIIIPEEAIFNDLFRKHPEYKKTISLKFNGKEYIVPHIGLVGYSGSWLDNRYILK